MTIRDYARLVLVGSLLTIPLMLLAIAGVDEPLATLVHRYGQPLQPAFTAIMVSVEWLQKQLFYHGIPVGWLALLLAFLVARMLGRPSSTVWLVMLLTMVGSEGCGNLLKAYFNRPRPSDVWNQTAVDGSFWSASGQFTAFPSGHTAWVAGVLLPLALRFPETRPWLLSLIGVVAVGRVVLEVHWLSDVVASIYLAFVLTCCFEIGLWWLRPKAASQLAGVVSDAT